MTKLRHRARALLKKVVGRIRRRLTRRREPGAWSPNRFIGSPPPGSNLERSDWIDVRDLIARTSIEDLNVSAEKYFSGLRDWDFHLAKPFASSHDAPDHLINLAAAIQSLRLMPGVRVLEFGAGTGWASRYLTQLGCRMILLDVSQTALEIAKELYRRHPVIGDQPPPEFLLFEGRRIDLPDASVERILCFDAFHHAPNPEVVLSEFGRVLVDGGRAVFSEPGPAHSKTEQSQYEMRTFGVVENDIDIRSIRETARAAGFDELKLSVFHTPSFHLDLEDYEDLIAGGETADRWLEKTQSFLVNVRNFYLTKRGEEPLDSRRSDGLAADIEIDVDRSRMKQGERVTVSARITNRGSARWLPSGTHPGGVSLGAHLFDASGQSLSHDFHWSDLSFPKREIVPGEIVEISFELPSLDPGTYRVEFDCVAERICWFREAGSKTVTVELEVVE